MQTEYIESEKIWRSPSPGIKYSGLGEAIFLKLNESDPKRVLEVNYESGIELTVDDVRRGTITVAQNLKRLGVKKDVISHNFELIDPTVIIFEEQFRDEIFTCLDSLLLAKLKHTLSIDSYELFKSSVSNLSFQPTRIEDPTKHPAALMFTSGSTGMPKVVVLSHALMMLGLHNKWWPLGSDTIICSYCDLRWIVQVEMMMQPVFFGTKRVYTSRPESAIGVEEKRAIIDKHQITNFCEVPMYYLELLASAERSKDPKTLSSLKIALVAGEVVTETLVDYSKRLIPHCKVIKCYGMTEVAGAVCTNELISKYDMNGGTLKDGFIVKIIDDDDFSLGPNEAGRLCLKSTAPLLGYLKNQKANEKAFLEGGWYDTGDCACMDSDNLLSIATRYHDLVRSSGTILVPSVVESIVNNHSCVLSSALVGHASPQNSKDHVGTLFVVPRSNHTFSNKIEIELKELLREELTNEQLNIVRYIRVIAEMPLKTCGKADRSALKVLADKLQKSYENLAKK